MFKEVVLMIIVSACLCGINCKYSGGNNLSEKALQLFQQGKAILVCPEQMGGLCTPRPACEISGGTGADVLEGRSRVLAINCKNDVTDEFIKGAEETLRLAKECGAEIAILKSGSPSCGHGIIYDGSFTGTKIAGNGVTAELMKRNGIKIITEEELDKVDI
jgi:uncharacterized protein YbbK (DUF523 family)